MQHFYDGQIRRYLTQLVRMFSGFKYQDGKGELTQIPVMYGDITRQVANIIRDNSENKIPSAPRMGVYITGLELARDRLADSSFVSKKSIRERAFDSEGNEYLNKSGRNYTVERLMPTPYTLTVNVDVWSTNTDQKLQILEQLLTLFNPSLELQTTDNYLDWTSLTVVNLDTVNWSSRTVPVGTETEIDVATLTFTTPIHISPPAKLKRLGVVTEVVSRVFESTEDLIDDIVTGDGGVGPAGALKIKTGLYISPTGELQRLRTERDWAYSLNIRNTGYLNTELQVINNTIKLVRRGVAGGVTWPAFLEGFAEEFVPGVTSIKLKRSDWDYNIVGTIAINPLDNTEVIVNWDDDTIPTDSIISGPNGDRSKIDYIIDPTKTNPLILGLSGNPRILLLGDIGDPQNEDGPDAWKNTDGSDFIASQNDIVEWDGSRWHIVFDADVDMSVYGIVYTTNLNTGVQYKYEEGEWLLSFEGEYPDGSWSIEF